jgi:DNA-binding HxlR family transcriptional regulator
MPSRRRPPLAPAASGPSERVRAASGHLRSSVILPVLDIIGDRWTLHILAGLLADNRRFDLLQGALGIARSTLSARLEDLVQHGLADRHRYQDRPPRDDYVLTEAGRDILPIVLLIRRWDAIWGPQDAAAGEEPVHRACGRALRPVLVCAHCANPVRMRDVAYVAGSGASGDILPSRRRRPRRRSATAEPEPGLLTAGDILGDRWTALVVATAFFGLRRFSDMQAALGVAPSVLSRRLEQLTDSGVFARHVYQERPRRAQYILTIKGLDLYPLTLAMLHWGDRWLAPASGPPLTLTHRTCGHTLFTRLACSSCGAGADLPGTVPA